MRRMSFYIFLKVLIHAGRLEVYRWVCVGRRVLETVLRRWLLGRQGVEDRV